MGVSALSRAHRLPLSRWQPESPYDVILPRATANSLAMGSANSTLRAEDVYAAQARQAAGPKDGRGQQVRDDGAATGRAAGSRELPALIFDPRQSMSRVLTSFPPLQTQSPYGKSRW